VKDQIHKDRLKWRRLTYAICTASVITAIGYVTEDQRVELLTSPGMFINVVFNGVMLMIPTGEEFYTLPTGAHLVLNLAFYTSIIFAASVMIPLIRDSMKGERILRTKGS
jgi:hypothetical protein